MNKLITLLLIEGLITLLLIEGLITLLLIEGLITLLLIEGLISNGLSIKLSFVKILISEFQIKIMKGSSIEFFLYKYSTHPYFQRDHLTHCYHQCTPFNLNKQHRLKS